jgi:hypothetical protein
MSTHSIHSEPVNSERSAGKSLDASRTAIDSLAALDLHAGRARTKAEWTVAQAKLLEFVTILRGWDQKAKNGGSEFGSVEVPCLREL